MPKFSEQDLQYAAELREEIHREALATVRKIRPDVTEVIDRHPVEDYFQELWDYPGQRYAVVAIPDGYGSRKAFVDAIVRDTLSGRVPGKARTQTQELRDAANAAPDRQKSAHPAVAKPDGRRELFVAQADRETGRFRAVGADPFYALLAGYPDLVVDYCLVTCERYCGYDSHRRAVQTAADRLCSGWNGDPDRAVGKRIAADELFSSDYPDGKLTYRKAFLYPPHKNGYTGKDFLRVNAALFPNGTDGLAVYEWDTDWSDYFGEGREWWGALCLTVYDETLGRFAVIMASATD